MRLLLLPIVVCALMQAVTYPTYPIGLGASTVTCLDKDADGYGIGSGCTGVDVDDNDREIHTTTQALNKYGSSLTFFLNHLGYRTIRRWFIATTGNDGTCAVNNAVLPCLTWAHVNALLVAGDAVLWRTGTYAPITLPSTTGTSTAPIILMAYPGEAVTIQATTDISAIDLGSVGAAEKSWFIIDGFTLNVTAASSNGGIQGGTYFASPAAGVIHSANVTIRNLDIKNTFYWGIIAQNTANWTVENSMFEGTRAASGEHNIYMGSNKETTNPTSGLTIQRNIIFNSSLNGNAGNGIQVNCGNICTGSVIQQNLIYNNALSGISVVNGNQDSFIRANVIFGNARNGIILFNYDGDCLTGTPLICPNDQTGNLIENNTIWTNGFDRTGTATSQAGILVSNTATGFVGNLGSNTYRNNIVTSVGGGINNDYPPVAISNSAGGTAQSTAYLLSSVFRNNILWPLDGGTGVIGLNSGASFGYQGYTCSGVASLTTISGCINSDPVFTASNSTAWYNLPGNFDFTPSGGSPAIAAGNTTYTSVRDAKSIRHPATPSIGGLEPVSGTAITTQTWTHFQMHGVSAEDAGYSTLRYVQSIHAACGLFLYQVQWTEFDRGWRCANYDDQSWYLFDKNTFFRSDTMSDAGHTVGDMVYIPRLGVMWELYPQSGTNMQDVNLVSYLFDFVGMAGRPIFTRNSSSGDSVAGIDGTVNIENTQPAEYDSKNDVIARCCDGNLNTWHTTPSNTFVETEQVTTGTNPQTWDASAYSPTDGLIYYYGGGTTPTSGASCMGATLSSTLSSYNTQTLAYSTVSTQGVSLPPTVRSAMAYSLKDNKILIVIGFLCTANIWTISGATYEVDMSTSPVTVTLISGAGTNGLISAGSGAYWDLAYDSDHNSFIFTPETQNAESLDGAAYPDSQGVYIYCISSCGRFGQSAIAFTRYAPSSGSFNRYGSGHTVASRGISNATDVSLAASGSVLYGAHSETAGTYSDNAAGNGNSDSIYGWQWTVAGGQAFLPAGADWTAIGNATGGYNSTCSSWGTNNEGGMLGLPSLAVISNNPVVSYFENCSVSGAMDSFIRVKFWNGSAWTGTSAVPLRGASSTKYAGQSQIVPIGTTAYVLHRDIQHSPASTTVAQCFIDSTTDGTIYTAVAGVIHVNSTGNTASCRMATDGTDLWVVEIEYVSSSQLIMGKATTTPQVNVFKCVSAGPPWTCTQQGSSLNVTASDYTSSADIIWHNGKPYVCWLERTITGIDQLYCAVSNNGGSAWTMLNSGNPVSRGGWAYRPQLATDGTTLYITWPEQSAVGSTIQIYAASYNGAVTQLPGSANPDTAGSSHAVSATVLSGNLIVAFQQQSYGTVPQIYTRQWSGSTWVDLVTPTGGGSSISGASSMGGSRSRR